MPFGPALSRRRDPQKPNPIEVLSASLGRGTDTDRTVGGVLERARSKVRRRRAGFPHHRASSRLVLVNDDVRLS